MIQPLFDQRFSPTLAKILLFPIALIFTVGCNNGSLLNTSGPYNPRNPFGAGPAGVSLSSTGGNVNPADLGSSGNYVIMAKTGISNATGSTVTGHIAVSPAAATYITGFSLIADATNEFSTSSSVVGKVYAANYSPPTPSNLTVAIGTMETAYTDAASRNPADFNNLFAGNIGSRTLAPGLYLWGTSVQIPTDVTISGGANDVWIFQMSGDLNVSAAKNVILAGGAQAKNIFWQVAGQVTILTGAHFEGIILSKTAVTFGSTASMNGRVYAQSMVSLNNNSITQP